MLNARRLREVLAYNAHTGQFVWRRSDKSAGTLRSDGYLAIRLDGTAYYAHRLAWLYMVGEWPETQIDHRNNIRSDNVWLNLRLASAHENARNAKRWRSVNLGLPKGVHKNKARFTSTITVNGHKMHLGSFSTPEEAHDAYRRAATTFHHEFARFE